MVTVCPKHVKNGLNVLEVPHIKKLKNNFDTSRKCKCTFCHFHAEYKLYDDLPYKKMENCVIKDEV